MEYFARSTLEVSNTSENILRRQLLKARRCRLRLPCSSKGQASQVDAPRNINALIDGYTATKACQSSDGGPTAITAYPYARFAFRPTAKMPETYKAVFVRFLNFNGKFVKT